jgi:2-amino-4-hydroxy-6-hydroxymethyldihydropteridine diphosphokinase
LNTVILAVGSNLDAKANVERAREIISKTMTLKAESAFLRTEAVDMPGAPDFLNGAFKVETVLELQKLKNSLKDIESMLGRKSAPRLRAQRVNESRNIDLDIIVFNGVIVSDDFERYDFVREAVLELAPDLKTSVE